MASIKNILFLFAILVSSTAILAQGPNSNNSNSGEHSSIPPHDGGEGSEEPPLASSAPGMFDHFPFKAPKFDWPQIPLAGFFTGESRQKRAVGRTVIRCNYATEGGFKCTGCNSVRRCYSFNMGTDSTCSGLFQYCNNGECSMTKGPLCSDTTSTSSSTTESTSSTGTTGSTSSTDSSSSSSSTSSSSSSSSTTASTSTTTSAPTT